MIRSSRCRAFSRPLQTLSAAAANDFPARCQRERYVLPPLYLRPYTLSGTSFRPVCYVFSRSYYDALADRHLFFLLILNTVHGILCGSTPSLEGCCEDIDGQDNEQREQQRQQALPAWMAQAGQVLPEKRTETFSRMVITAWSAPWSGGFGTRRRRPQRRCFLRRIRCLSSTAI